MHILCVILYWPSATEPASLDSQEDWLLSIRYDEFLIIESSKSPALKLSMGSYWKFIVASLCVSTQLPASSPEAEKYG